MLFLELSCIFDDPADVGYLISGSAAFSKTTFNIWKFTVHVLLKPGLENFELYFTSMWDDCKCVVFWAFFGLSFLWDWMTSGETIHLTRQNIVGKVISLVFSILSRLVITFFPRSKRLLIPWLQSPSSMILEPQKIKSGTVSTVSPSISREVMGPDAMI